jgi:hypothetical protein
MNDLPFKFPILTIPKSDPEPWEMVDVHFDRDAFTIRDRGQRESPDEIGRIVMDSAGRSWRIVAMRDLGVQADSPWARLWLSLLGDHRVKWEVSEELYLPFEDIRDAVATTILDNPDLWRDEEACAGEGEPPRDEQVMLDELVGNVRKARSPLELMAAIDSHGGR